MDTKRLIHEGLAKRAFPHRPRVKEYLKRVVEDIDEKQDLLYTKYQCAGSKTDYSKALLEMVHDGMMSPNGLSNTIKNIRRRRQARYYKLYTLFVDRVRYFKAYNPNYAASTFPTVSDYCAIHSVVDSQVLTSAWMESTAMYGPLCELLMQNDVDASFFYSDIMKLVRSLADD
ncbi:hypothetical protein PHMEG_00013198 [Phytophthora megakarya]|uniref:Uncharacterized protein n=1 Tax=Phytophthora megakarya TaxID=4795 RepID=A0A225W8I7_9STRA|nr:hypothetical protein PHMEG_00013198 [Phytophthora megakarya]